MVSDSPAVATRTDTSWLLPRRRTHLAHNELQAGAIREPRSRTLSGRLASNVRWRLAGTTSAPHRVEPSGIRTLRPLARPVPRIAATAASRASPERRIDGLRDSSHRRTAPPDPSRSVFPMQAPWSARALRGERRPPVYARHTVRCSLASAHPGEPTAGLASRPQVAPACQEHRQSKRWSCLPSYRAGSTLGACASESSYSSQPDR